MNTLLLEKKRLNLVDALRGFALLGIVLIHHIDHFDLSNTITSGSSFLSFMNNMIQEEIFFIFGGKSYAIFALLFGFSFFIQFENKSEEGLNFAGRFTWRMVLLFCFGLFHVMFYSGEILSCYAIAGLFLIPFRNKSNKTLLWLSFLCMLQPWELSKIIYAFLNSSYLYKYPDYHYYFEAVKVAKNSDSFIELVKVNLHAGFLNAHLFAWYSGRYFQTLSLFFLGMYLGRKQLFQKTDNNQTFWLRTLYGSLLTFIIFYPVKTHLSELGLRIEIYEPLKVILNMWTNFSMMVLLVTLFVIAWYKGISRKFHFLLIPYGRMSLTNYITTSMVGSFIYYQYGLGLYSSAGVMWSLFIGIILFFIQAYFSKWWLSRYKRGPMEWIWYKLTYII